MRFLFVIVVLAATGCADVKSHSTSTLNDGAIVHSFKCDDNWDGCYRAAAKACGDRGYTEIDRLGDNASTASGRFEKVLDADDGVRSQRLPDSMPRDPRTEGVLTIRCNLP